MIPLRAIDEFVPSSTPDMKRAKDWFLRAVRLSRKSVVACVQKSGVPEGWKKSPLLRSCFPLLLDKSGRWTDDLSVYLDQDLGIVYESRGAK